MDTEAAILSLTALAQPTRLDVFRLLVKHEPDGVAAGDIAKALAVPHNTLSTHLAVLTRADLIRAERHSRSIIYRANLDQFRQLTLFLVRDCCNGSPELCEPLIASLSCCPPNDVVIYHNPECGTSRNALAMIRNAGIEPHVIEYLKTPPARALLVQLLDRAGMSVREVLREKGTPYADLGLGNQALTDVELLDAIEAHPILINRPIVVSPVGVKLCRPSEVVLDLLPTPQRGAFTKEDGEAVTDEQGSRIVPEAGHD